MDNNPSTNNNLQFDNSVNNNVSNMSNQLDQNLNLNQSSDVSTVNPFENNSAINNPVNKGYVEMLKKEGINVQNNSRFINDNEFNETSINDLNINNGENDFNRIDYSRDPMVMQNIEEMRKPEKMTITITKELKFIIIVALILFVFIFVMPYIFDFFRDINN